MIVHGAALLNVEAQPRYHDLLEPRWPVRVSPQPDELLSSWLHRLGLANGLAPRDFAAYLGAGSGNWSGRLDLALPIRLRRQLSARTGIDAASIAAMTLSAVALPALLLPLRIVAPNSREARRQATWLQFCPRCLAEDEQAYFRKAWRMATTIGCHRHRRVLLDRCPGCQYPPASFDQSLLVAQHFCVQCGGDFRAATAPRLGAMALRTAARLAELTARAGPSNEVLVKAIQALPTRLDPPWPKPLTSLSAKLRASILIEHSDAVDALFNAALPDGPVADAAKSTSVARSARLHVLLTAYAAVQRRRVQSSNNGAASPSAALATAQSASSSGAAARSPSS